MPSSVLPVPGFRFEIFVRVLTPGFSFRPLLSPLLVVETMNCGCCTGESAFDVDDAVESDPSGRFVRYNEELGRGAFKTIYKAFDQLEGIEVAWNQVRIAEVLESPVSLHRLYSEVHILKSLRHNKIMKFFCWWIDPLGKTANIITELFTSGSLRQYREKHKRVDMKAVKGWARQILMGLDYLHSKNPPIIHRDLKCDSIFVNGNHGEVKIGDLGVATVLQQSSAQGILGNPEFMAPEMYGENYNELVDIYSFGLCLLEMITFEYPYSECPDATEICRKVTSGIKPAALSKVKDLEAKYFIEKCLVPATERLPAKELLNDPFLASGKILLQEALPKPNVSEDPQASTSCIPKLPDYSEDDIECSGPALIYEVKKCAKHVPGIFVLEVLKMVKEVEFKLQGRVSTTETGIVKLFLRIDDGHDPAYVHFAFFLESDTAASIASEMGIQLGIHGQYVKVVSEIIDSLLFNLVDGWEPCVPVHRLAIFDEQGTHDSEINMLLLVGPTNSLTFENASGSTDVWKIDIAGTFDDSIMMHEANMVEDDVVILNSDEKILSNEHSSASSMTCNEYAAKEEINYFADTIQKSIDSIILVDGVSSISVNDDDEELRLELERIDFHYQKVFEDVYKRRDEAISDAKSRAASRRHAVG